MMMIIVFLLLSFFRLMFSLFWWCILEYLLLFIRYLISGINIRALVRRQFVIDQVSWHIYISLRLLRPGNNYDSVLYFEILFWYHIPNHDEPVDLRSQRQGVKDEVELELKISMKAIWHLFYNNFQLNMRIDINEWDIWLRMKNQIIVKYLYH